MIDVAEAEPQAALASKPSTAVVAQPPKLTKQDPNKSSNELDDEQENASNAKAPARKVLASELISRWASLFISVVPVLLALVIMVCLTLIVLTGLTSAFVTVIVIAAIPLGIVLWFMPRLQLMGYEPLSSPPKSSDTTTGESSDATTAKESKGWGKLRRNSLVNRSRSVVDSIPWMAEVFELLTLSDYVYLFSDFRSMSLRGKIPVQFKYLALECDEMSQWDIIRGKPHEEPAYDNDRKGHAGIRSSTLIVLLLRILFNAHQKAAVASEEGDETYRGLQELEELFVGVLRDTSCPCHE